MADDIVLGFRAEGLPQTQQQVEALERVLERLNTGSQGGGYGSTLPSGAPANAPRLSNGLDAYNSSPGVSAPPPVAAIPSLTPYQSPTAPPAPGAYAPNPFGGGSTSGTVLHASSVTVVTSGGGGQYGGSYGPSGSGGGGFGPPPMSPGTGAPPPPGGGYGPVGGGPFGGWNPWGGSGGGNAGGGGPQNLWQLLSGFGHCGSPQQWLQNIPLNFNTPGFGLPNGGRLGFGGLASSSAGVGLAAGVGLGFAGFDYGQSIYYAAQAPNYAAETDIMAAAAGGRYLSPVQIQSARQMGQLRGTHDEINAAVSPIMDTFGRVPLIGSIIKRNWQMDFEQPYERDTALQSAHATSKEMRNQLSAMTGEPVPTGDDKYLSTRFSLARSAGFFGRGSTMSMLGVDFDKYAGKFSADAVGSALSSVYGAGMAPGNADIFSRLNGAAAPDALGRRAASYYAGIGDVSTVQTLQPLMAKVSGLFDSLMSSAQSVFLSKARQQLAESNISYLGSAATVTSYGGSSTQVEHALGLTSAAYGPDLQEAQSQYSAALTTGNANAIADARSRLESVRAQARSARREQESYRYSIRQGDIGVGSASADAASTRARLYGGPEDVYAAGLRQAGVTRASMRAVGEQLHRTDLTPTERLDLERQEIDLRRQLNQTLVENKRNLADMNLSLATARLSIAQTISSGAMQYLGIGGSGAQGYVQTNVAEAKNVYQAAVAKLNVLKSQGVSNDNPDYVAAQAAVNSAKNQVYGTEDSLASVPFSARSQDTSVVGNTQLNVLQNTYAAYGDIRGIAAGLLRNVGSQISETEKNRRAETAQIQRDLKSGLITQQEAQERMSQVKLNFDSAEAPLVNQAVGYQNTLQNGWMDRLISQSINMPGRGVMVASQFTAREAAPFLGAINGAFGFSGKSGQADRDYWLHRGDRIANTLIGNVTRPEGFLDTAMSMGPDGANAPMYGPVPPSAGPLGGAGASPMAKGNGIAHGHFGGIDEASLKLAGLTTLSRGPAHGGKAGAAATSGEIVIRVIVEDKAGNQIGKGSSSGTIHDLLNGALTITQSPHAAGTARQ